MITPTESLILALLIARPTGAYGSDLLDLSGGRLKRGSVYTLLGRLEEQGLVKTKDDPKTPGFALARSVYQVTAQGQKAFIEFGEFTGQRALAMGGA